MLHTGHDGTPRRFALFPIAPGALLRSSDHAMSRLLILAALCLPISVLAQNPLQEFRNCRLVDAEWADGDSFQVKADAGKVFTVRLYGIDCIELHVNDESDVSRLRAQSRYFGVEKSLPVAKSYGLKAKEEVQRVLAKPFTVHSSFADGRGDPNFKRVYAFVFLHDGTDLGEHLVTRGLARAYGVSRGTPSGLSREDYLALLQDLELRAAKKGTGIWAETDWDSLPAERSSQRRDEAEFQELTGKGKLVEGQTININTASRDELMRLPQILEARAMALIESRPYRDADDLSRATGIKDGIIEKILPFIRFGDPAEAE